MNYKDIYNNIIRISGSDLSKFEQYALIIHAIFLKNNLIYKDNKILENDWNKEYDKANFEYFITNQNDVKVKVDMRKDPDNADKILIDVSASCDANNNKVNINSGVNLNDPIVTKIDFENLDETLKDLEKFIRETLIKEILKTGESQRNDNNNDMGMNVNQNLNRNYPYESYLGEVDPNRLLNQRIDQGGYNPLPNPYFTTGGGSVGGNLVGPTSDIFTGNMFPQPQHGIHNPVRYDPIGPFGTFGGPHQHKRDIKKTDPMFGGNPFGGDFPPLDEKKKFPDFNRGPYGGGPDKGFGGGFGGPFI